MASLPNRHNRVSKIPLDNLSHRAKNRPAPAKARLRDLPLEQVPELLSVKQAADFEDVSPDTIYNWIGEGLPHTRHGRGRGTIRIAKADLLRPTKTKE